MLRNTKDWNVFFLILFFCLGVTSPGYARNLIPIGLSRDADGEVTSYIDRDGFRKVGRFVWFWNEWVKHDYRGKIIRHSRAYFSADCSNNSFRTREVITLIEAGQTVNTHENYGDSKPVQLAPPGSVIEETIQHACRNF